MIWGGVLSTILTLVVVPIVYYIVQEEVSITLENRGFYEISCHYGT